MRTITMRLTLGLLVLGIGGLVVVRHNRAVLSEKRSSQDEVQLVTAFATRREQLKQSVARMASEHHAVTDWKDALGGKKFVEKLQTAEIAPALVRNDARPVLLIGALRNVITLEHGCTATFEVKANLLSQVRFALGCTSEQAKQFVNNPTEASLRFAVIAQVDAVHPGEQFTADDNHSGAQEFALAEGRCLDLIYVGDYIVDSFKDFDALLPSETEHPR
jgi:hypothetical protein